MKRKKTSRHTFDASFDAQNEGEVFNDLKMEGSGAQETTSTILLSFIYSVGIIILIVCKISLLRTCHRHHLKDLLVVASACDASSRANLSDAAHVKVCVKVVR